MNRLHLCLLTLIVCTTNVTFSDVNDLVISEFMAVNDSTLEDIDGDFTDWFEVLNTGSTPVNLAGIYATDNLNDPAKWPFPAIELNPGLTIVVFASNKDRRVAGEEPHTNFRLTSVGEDLALVDSDGTTVIHAYLAYPQQIADVSYGLRQTGGGVVTQLISTGDSCTAFVPSNNSLALTWTTRGFNDASWQAGPTGVGYDTGNNPSYLPLIATNVGAQMAGVNSTIYIRVPFTAPANIAEQGLFRLNMKYDDGYRAYINGVEIADKNSQDPSQLADPHLAEAPSSRNESLAVVFEEVVHGGAAGILQPGTNVLAIHGVNRGSGSSDFLMIPELEVESTAQVDITMKAFFTTPTPGGANGTGFPDVATTPILSPNGNLFNGSVNVFQLAAPLGSTFRYTTDGTVPLETSSEFPGGGLSFSESTLLRVRGFELGSAPGQTVTKGYMNVANNVIGFQSPLPIILIDTFGVALRDGNNVGLPDFRNAYMAIFMPVEGQTTITTSTVADIESRIGIRTRGSSSDGSGRDKKSYRFEFRDENDSDQTFTPLGLPRESDWILFGAHNWDRSLLRNPFIYSLSNQIGQYAVRTKPCEVFINSPRNSDPTIAFMTLNDFFGYYTFMESIKRDGNRVDITKLNGNDSNEPNVTGGYIFKIDRDDQGEPGTFSGGGRTFVHVDPDTEVITPSQEAWLSGFLDDFAFDLNSGFFTHPRLGYARHINPATWIDHNILGTFVMNVDALRLSAYFYKDREGLLNAGPIWDNDRSIDSTDERDDTPTQWWKPPPRGTSEYFNYGWWDRLFEDNNFMQRWVDRWAEIRDVEFTLANVHGTLDALAAEISTIAQRNFDLTPDREPSGGWTAELVKMKTWLQSRLSWIDDQFVTRPSFSAPGQQIIPGFSLTITAPRGTIYVTRDGTDPRLSGGAVAPEAEVVASGASITIMENELVVARALDPAHPWSPEAAPTFWSAPMIGSYWVDLPPVVVTEIMYNPSEAPDRLVDSDQFEFIELQNIGAQAVNLEGARIFRGIDFVFPDLTLNPGEVVLVVSNLAAFESRYETTGMIIAGEYDRLLSNAGDNLGFEGALGEPIHEFLFDDVWYAETDGLGESLELVSTATPLSAWGEKASWMPSGNFGGTPGIGLPLDDGLQRPGDGNQDGVLDIADALWLLEQLFAGSTESLPCGEGLLTQSGNFPILNVNGDGDVDISDALYTLIYLFGSGAPPSLGTDCILVPDCPTTCTP